MPILSARVFWESFFLERSFRTLPAKRFTRSMHGW